MSSLVNQCYFRAF